MAEHAHLLPESSDGPPPDHDNIVVLEGATWADFQRLLEIRADEPSPRMAYSEGRLELMSPSRSHEVVRSMIGRLVETWCLERGVDITPYGSWTLQDEAVQKGLEPDECYVVGDHADPERPDLAIEVFCTSGRLAKLDIYRALGVREVWIWRKGRIEPYVLTDDGYERREASRVFDGIDLEELARFVDVRPMTRAVRAYRAALQGR